ncbi:hypothetical protein [Devosia alba]|uniref:hypothetical protein n=1 Tax=Devosia alba TaxID=3152360 RepID=UPI003267B02C
MANTDADWLDKAASYFEKHPTDGEDMAFWANVANAERCRTIAARLRAEEADTCSAGDEAVMELFVAAMAEADKAMRKFPQPNYVISKVAEEAGEVVKAAIHCAEGRDTPEHVAEEIRQAMAMLIRLYVEGDQVHGLPSIYSSIEAQP